MDIDEENENVREEEEVPQAKKQKRFAAKEFRQKLRQEFAECLNALKEFSVLCNGGKGQDCIKDYLESGGSCLEILQLLEKHTKISTTVVTEIAKNIILSILKHHPQYQERAEEAARYLLNNHLTVVNNQLGLKASLPDRKSILKLLTAVVTLSPSLARDVLVNITFDKEVLELITKPDAKAAGVRAHFIHFLLAFLVNGHWPTINALLEKHGLLVSIIHDMQYDPVNTVTMVLATLRSSIVENPAVSKTVKIRTFKPSVLRDIVNLYNWRGPENCAQKQADSKKAPKVNETDKQEVCESVHEFLLILCTNYKYGIVFRDKSIGTKKTVASNNLLKSVLRQLERPWDHEFAGKLVVEICYACPDALGSVWSNVKSCCELGVNKRNRALDFAQLLIAKLEPSCLEFAAKEMDGVKLFNVVNSLIVPSHVLKTLHDHEFKLGIDSYKCLALLSCMLDTLFAYLGAAKVWLNIEENKMFHSLLYDYVVKSFPRAVHALKNYLLSYAAKDFQYFEHLDVILKLLYHYKRFPELLDAFAASNSLNNTLSVINNYETNDTTEKLTIKTIKIHVDIDPLIFSGNEKTLHSVLPSLIEHLRVDNLNEDIHNILNIIFIQTNAFEGCAYEIDTWIRSVIELKTQNVTPLCEILLAAINEVSKNVPNHLLEVANIKQNLVNSETSENDNFNEMLQLLMDEHRQNVTNASILHTNLSVFLFGICDVLAFKDESDKSVLEYINLSVVNLLHLQTNPELFVNVLCYDKFREMIMPSVFNYCKSWTIFDEDFVPLSTLYDDNSYMVVFSKALLKKQLKPNLFKQFNLKRHEVVNLLQMVVFYFAQMLKSNKFDAEYLECFVKLFDFLVNGNSGLNADFIVRAVLQNPSVFQYFSVPSAKKTKPMGLCTQFILKLLAMVKDNNCSVLNKYLMPYRNRIVSCTLTILEKCEKYKISHNTDDIMQIIKTFGFELDHSRTILNCLAKLPETALISEENNVSIAFYILIYSFEKYNNLHDKKNLLHPLDKNVVLKISKYYVDLAKHPAQVNLDELAILLKDYLEHYPHNIPHIDPKLFEIILQHSTFSKNFSLLATFLLQRDSNNLSRFLANLQSIADKKGMLLPLTEAAILHDVKTDDLQKIYALFEHGIAKALAKPHKAASHFKDFYPSIAVLIKHCITENACKPFVAKTQKYDTSEVFHVHLLVAIFEKLFFTLGDKDERHITNALLTLSHLCLNLLKKTGADDNENWDKLNQIVELFSGFITKITSHDDFSKLRFAPLLENEAIKVLTKYCLKYGISGNVPLLNVLCSFNKLLNFNADDVKLFMEMILSHSEFLDLVLGEESDSRKRILELVLIFCERHPTIMTRNHVPIWLSAYHASMTASDLIILKILRGYEAENVQTHFHDFRPYLWGSQAAIHYSLRSNVQNSLWRQPRAGDILDLLQEEWVLTTVTNFPTNRTLQCTDKNPSDNVFVYDPAFLLPMFNLLLAPESDIRTFKFTKSGALAITISSLSSNDKDMRRAACNVLARLHFHMEAKQHGKDKLLWMRLLEVVCKGTAVLDKVKLSGFASLFFSEMVITFTEPLNPMYLPLSNYLSAREVPDLSSIPEIYALLHSSDVNFQQHRCFMLKIFRDGLRTDADVHVMLRSMAFKFIMDFFSSSLADPQSQDLILQIICNACKIGEGFKLLSTGYGLFPWLYSVVQNLEQSNSLVMQEVVNFCAVFLGVEKNLSAPYASMFTSLLVVLLEKVKVVKLEYEYLLKLLNVLHTILDKYPKLLTDGHLKCLIDLCDADYCTYLLKFGCKYVGRDENLATVDLKGTMTALITKYINVNKIKYVL